MLPDAPDLGAEVVRLTDRGLGHTGRREDLSHDSFYMRTVTVTTDQIYHYPTWNYDTHPIDNVHHLNGKYAPWASVATTREVAGQEAYNFFDEREVLGGARDPATDPVPSPDPQLLTPTP